MNYKIALIPGDGIGPEIVAEAKKVLDKVCETYGHSFSYEEVLLGGASIDVHGVPLTEEAVETAKASDAVLMGSIGGDAKTSPWYKSNEMSLNIPFLEIFFTSIALGAVE